MYKGLDAGLARQMTYGMTRLGVFRTLSDWCKRKIERERPTGSAAGDQAPVQLPLWQKGVCALTAGGIGAMVGNPADLAVVRLTADAGLPNAKFTCSIRTRAGFRQQCRSNSRIDVQFTGTESIVTLRSRR